MLEKLGLSDRATFVLRALDKLDKTGTAKVAQEMQATAQLTDTQCDQVLSLAQLTGTNDQILKSLAAMLSGVEQGEQGVERLSQIVSAVQAAGVPNERFRIDVSIARGLDYYTGVVFETILNQLPSIGSVCSGGRYDNLAELYTKQHLPGIGASLGLDRLLTAMEQLEMLPKRKSTADIFIPLFDAQRLNEYLKLATLVRGAGWNVELYPDAKKLGQQLKYADERGFRIALVAGSDELDRGACQIKDLQSKVATEATWRDDPTPLLIAIQSILSPRTS